ncbi:LANO_0E13872g1_1 [Lachancea nothofagi CBS 11611]|uniref:LANO_0E13872g1_1 n=1 Tax=Lachancea nothofagi CBS 11611 TaxID=1266666 RepID=A0A1G4JZB8_9SACH|nr:LANO_0E13872g1_1 [Lachancea nothofagi CBS 11611]
MSFKTPILDKIVSSENDDSRELDVVGSDEDESFAQLDGDAFRLDRNQAKRHQSPKKKTLFVDDESFAESPVKSGLLGHSPTQSPLRKVQFDTQHGVKRLPADPWDFKTLILEQFEERLPEGYDLRNWRRPSRKLVSNMVDILENNVTMALEQTFAKYTDECNRAILDRSVKGVRKEKEQMLFHLIGKIEHRLRRSRFPSRATDRDLDIEYIYAKRKFIQDRFSRESNHLELVEHQIQREQNTLDELKASQSRHTDRSARRSKELTEQLSNNLHPALSKAMINSFGLLRDNAANRDRYHQDVDDLNLKLEESVSQDSLLGLQDHFPAIREYRASVQKLRDSCQRLFKEPEQQYPGAGTPS